MTQCKGEGQGSCKSCSDKGKWNRNWMCFLYEIQGIDGCYCYQCAKEMEEQNANTTRDTGELHREI